MEHNQHDDPGDAMGCAPPPTVYPTRRVYAAFIMATCKSHGPRASGDREAIERLIAEAERLYIALPQP